MDKAGLRLIEERTHMSYSDRNVNNGSAAAALGLAVAIDDIENVGNDTNSHNSSSVDSSSDNDVIHSNNQDNDTSYDNDSLDVAVSDDDVVNSYNQDNDTITKTINDNDTYTKTVNLSDNDTITKTVNLSDNDTTDSYNQDNDSLNLNVNYSDNDTTDSYNQDNDTYSDNDTYTYNDNDVSDSNNTTTTSIDTTVDVAISDAFNTITDSNNQDNDWLDLDGLDFDVLSAIGEGVLAGEGNDTLFNLAQVSELSDADTLYSPTVTNSSGFDVCQTGDGGDNAAGGDAGDRGTSTTSADGVAQLEAFTQNIVMGANIQYNNVDISVVGGDSTVSDGDIS
jgi:hypothetical protein